MQKMKNVPEILMKVLSFDDIEWAGIKQVFHTFFERVKALLLQDEFFSKDVDEHLSEINDYVILKLYKTIFSNKIQS
jgi:hypothetical protein